MGRKEIFKRIIAEFHERKLPAAVERDIGMPETGKIVTLTGARRAGKTFLMFQMMRALRMAPERIVYVNFEDDRLLPLDAKDLDTLLEAYYELFPEHRGHEIYLFFDEIQNVAGWEAYVRRIHDTEKCRIFLTGSNAKLLSREIATGLRGRTLPVQVYPLSFREFLRFNGIEAGKTAPYSGQRFVLKKQFERYLRLGGFPEVVLERNGLEMQILDTYFELMIFRDIVERFSVRNTALLRALAKYLLTNAGNLFSINTYFTSLKETTAVGKETVFEYVSHLEEAQMVFLVPLFSYSLKRQQVNPKKVYCIDPGLRNAISFLFSGDEGRLVENLVFLELKRRGYEPFYWKGEGEVDFVVKHRDHTLTALNVTYSEDVPGREIDALLEFKGQSRGVRELLLLTRDAAGEERGVTIMPAWQWLLGESSAGGKARRRASRKDAAEARE